MTSFALSSMSSKSSKNKISRSLPRISSLKKFPPNFF